MSKTINVDFFQIDTPAGVNFEELIRTVANMRAEERNFTRGVGGPIRLQSVTDNTDTIEGDMIKIRMDEVPIKASLNGNTEFIALNDDEGIGEDTAFLYYTPFNVLLLQRNRYAVSGSSFAHYFKNVCGVDYVFLNPILRTDIMLKLNQMTIFRKFNVRIAGVSNADMFRDQVHGIASIIHCKEDYQAPDIKVTVSMGKARGSLTRDRIRASIETLLRISHDHEKKVKKLDLFAQEDYSSPTEYLDVLKARIIEQVAINLDRNRRLPYEYRRDALREAWSRRRDELGARFTTRRG